MTTLQDLGIKFQRLRAIKGQWEGGEYNAMVDSQNGAKHQLLKQIGELIEVGSDSQQLVEVLGQPDEISSNGVFNVMPGPYISNKFKDDTLESIVKMKYNWRGEHDYLWFSVDVKNNTIVNKGWYHAME